LNSKLSVPNRRTIILTGATGVVGSHVLFELLLQILQGQFEGKIILLVRGNLRENLSGYDRIVQMLTQKFIPNYLKGFSVNELLAQIVVIECEFSKDDLSNILSEIKMEESVFLIHSAASTNLAPNDSAEKENHEVNYKGSLQLFESCKTMITKFIYISTVYACGRLSGVIKNEYSKLENPDFTNPYEEYKFKTERALSTFCEESNIEYQILRPGVVVGRLIDAPLYYLPKYNVVYAFAAFFHNLKKRGINERIQIKVNPHTSLHLVSVDYVAKSIAKAYTDSCIKELNIIPRQGCKASQIRSLLKVVGYDNYQFVGNHAPPQNPFQRAYQSKVAPSFEPYINNEAFEFDNDQLLTLLEDVNMPNVDDHFQALISYAVDKNFEEV
jgi:nucleoside-diphosphate-sugar epimerase|tara:strand:- start:1537 stop:2691 length:1155 start_codon:yes stop_codon:yes gene_type:complete